MYLTPAGLTRKLLLHLLWCSGVAVAGPDHRVPWDSVQGAGLGQHPKGSLPLGAAALLTCCKGERLPW